MSLNTTTYSVAPYHDDYNEDKGFLRVLFKPGIAVQTRELNTLQTQLQDQVNRLGGHFFQEGSPIIDGGVSIDNGVPFIDVVFTDSDLQFRTDNQPETYLNLINQLIKGESTPSRGIFVQENTSVATAGSAKEIEADVLSVEALTETVDETKYRFFIRYTSSSELQSEFQAETTLRTNNAIIDSNGNTKVEANFPFATISKVGTCTRIKVNEGVYYIDGHFVKTVEQDTIIENPATRTPITGEISFKSDQTIVQYTDDTSLLDNATGTPNEQAPGADRYKIALTVVLNTDQASYLNIPFNANKVFSRTTENTQISKFVTIQKLEDGKELTPVIPRYSPESNRFAPVLAKRTYEESGNYCLNPFMIDIREAFNDGFNRGRIESTLNSEKEILTAQYAIGIEPSTAYVEGFRVEILNRKEILAPKARDEEVDEQVFTNSGKGRYVEGYINWTGGSVVLPAFGDTLNVLSQGGTDTNNNVIFNNLEYVSGNKYRLYFSLTGSTTLADVALAKFFAVGTTSGASTFKFTSFGGGSFKEHLFGSTTSNTLIPLPQQAVSNVDTASTNFTVRKRFDLAKSGTSASFTLASGGTETFYSNDVDDYIVLNTTTNALLPVISAVPSGTSVTLSFSGDIADTNALDIYASVRDTYTLGTKTETSATVTNVAPSQGTTIALGVKDIIEITSITSNQVADVTKTGATDTTDLGGGAYALRLGAFELDNGQREGTYENGTLTYNGASTLSGTITINFKHFTHSSSSNQYFTRNSYPTTFDYEKIPSFNGRRLSDVIDFRTPAAGTGVTLDANSVIQTKINYYLPRIDQLIVTTDGKFSINKGVASLNPSVPDAPKKSMALYNIFLPAYTFDASQIKVDYIDHRRYTMRDIAKIDKKVKQLEYYTSLSLLEKEASSKKIFDANGERFKAGMIVDSFTGHNVGDVRDRGYKCAIDPKEGTLRPSYEMNNIEFNATDVSQIEDVIRLQSVGSQDLIVQDKASTFESIMPYDVVTYKGILELSPSSDDWKEVRRRPDVVVDFDGNLDAIQFLAEEANVLGTQWNEWETNWSGVVDSTSTETINQSQRISSTDVFNTEGTQPNTIDTVQRTVIDRVQTVQTTTINTIKEEQSRSGVRNNLDISTIKEDLGDRVVDVGFVPFIRSRRIYFKATEMKPNTKLYAYFDETNVTSYCTKIGVNGMGTSASHSFAGRKFRKLGRSDRLDFFNNTSAQAFTTIGDTYKDLVTNSDGTLEGYFIIPNNSNVRFRTGDRTFKLSDNPNGIDDETSTTVAKAVYSARGLITSTENTIVTTRKINFNQDRISDARTLSRTTSDTTTESNVTQIETEEVVGTITLPEPRPTVLLSRSAARVDEGSSVTITLTTTNIAANTTVGYTVSGVETGDFATGGFAGSNAPTNLQGSFTIGANGIGTQVFTFANDGVTENNETFTLTLNDFGQNIGVVIGDTSSEPPPAPVVLQTVIVQNFRVDPIAQTFHLSDANNKDGAFLKDIDLFFQKKHPTLPVRVQIVTAENGIPTQAVLPFGEVSVPASSINVSNDASAATTFSFPAPVYLQPDQEYAFIVRGQSTENKIFLGKMGDNDLITGKKIDKQPAVGVALKSANATTWTPIQDRDIKYTIRSHKFLNRGERLRRRRVGPGNITETATSKLSTVLPQGFSSSNPVKATAFKLNAERILLPKTEISFELKVSTSQGYRTYVINPNQTLYLGEQVSIATANDFELTPILTTRSQHITPMLDLDRLSVVAINNVVNNDSTNETNAKHGNAEARYITRLVKLEKPADKVTMYLNVNRPSEKARIEVYARSDRNGAFTKLSVPSLPISSSTKSFREIEVEFDPPLVNNHKHIEEFQIKIVLLSSDAAFVPRISDFRAIATI